MGFSSTDSPDDWRSANGARFNLRRHRLRDPAQETHLLTRDHPRKQKRSHVADSRTARCEGAAPDPGALTGETHRSKRTGGGGEAATSKGQAPRGQSRQSEGRAGATGGWGTRGQAVAHLPVPPHVPGRV